MTGLSIVVAIIAVAMIILCTWMFYPSDGDNKDMSLITAVLISLTAAGALVLGTVVMVTTKL